MRGSLTIGKIDSIPLEIHLTWPPAFLLTTWSLAVFLFPSIAPGLTVAGSWAGSLLTSLSLFASLIAHELGHAAFARRCGLEVRQISLFYLGGLIEIDLGSASALEEAGIALAGPAVSLALGLMFGGGWLLLGPSGPVLSALFLYLAFCNLLLGLFNLLPGGPLDGGRILRAVLWHYLGDPAIAARWAGWLGVGISVITVGVGVMCLIQGSPLAALWLIAVGVFLIVSGRDERTPSPSPPR